MILSGVLLFECNAPALALDYGNISYDSQALELEEKIDNAYIKENTSVGQYDAVIAKEVAKQKEIIKPLAEKMVSYRAAGNKKYGGNFFRASAYTGAVSTNTVGKLVYELKRFLAGFYAQRRIMPFNEFKKQYSEFITNEAKQYAKENNYTFNSNNSTVNDIVKEIEKQYPAQKMYKEYVSIAQKELNWYKAHEQKLNEAAYQILREYVKALGVNMNYEAARLLLNLKINNKDVVTSAEKQELYNYITSRIKEVDLKSAFDFGILKSNKKGRTKVAGKMLQDIIDLMMLGVYVVPQNDSAYSEAVVSLIDKSMDTAAFPHILNAGFSALLTLKRYDKLNIILDKYTNIEAKGTSFVDALSFQFFVDSFNNIQGNYLRGAASKGAQYTTEYGYRNAFEDIAVLLAEEGSKDSLALLKKYGVNNNRPIMPFLAGALLAGKAGAQASESSKKMGLDPDSYLALKIANTSMGDLTLTQESDLDMALLLKYPAIKSHLGSGAIVNQNSKNSKKTSRKVYDYASNAAMAGDVAFMVWATFDLVRLAGKAVSLGKATYMAGKIAKITDPALRLKATLGNMSKIRPYVSARLALRGFSGRVKGAMAGVVLAQRNLYTSEALPAVVGGGAANTTVAKALATTSFDMGKGGLVIDKAAAYKASAGAPNRVLDIMNTQKALNVANANATQKFFAKSFFEKYKKYPNILARETRNAFRQSNFRGRNFEAAMDFGYNLKGLVPGIQTPERASAMAHINWLSRPLGTTAKGTGSLELFYRASEADDPMPLPVNITLGEKKIPNIKADKVSNVLLTGQENAAFKLAFEHENVLVNPTFFKVGLDNENFANLARLTLGGTKELKIKLLAENTSLAARSKNWFLDLFRNKDKIMSGTGSVWIKEGSTLRSTPINLSTHKDFNGVKVLIDENNKVSILGRSAMGSKPTPFTYPYSFSIPKSELPVFTQYAKLGNFNTPLNITLNGARDKVNTLYAVQFLSLSAASTGLIGPLRQNYPEMSNTQESLITVALPYLPSFLSPFWAPFVKRFGSANMMKVSLGLAASSLALSTATGFGGWSDANIYNLDKPSLTPLLFSAGFIGLSSSLTRAAFNPLMKEMGGGGGLLRGMMYKNLSSFAMLLPPAVFAVWDAVDPRYYTDTGKIDGNPIVFQGDDVYGTDGSLVIAKGQPIVDKDGLPLKHSHVDFSISNPVLLGITGAILYKFHTAHMSRLIGSVPGYTLGQSIKPLAGNSKFMYYFNNNLYRPTFGVLKESVNSTKVMFRKEVWPITAAGFGALGVEASLFNKYSQNEANNYLTDVRLLGINVGDPVLRPIAATFLLAVPQFLVRYKSKPLIAKLGGESNPLTYKKLIGLSLGSAAAGTALLATEDNFWTFAAGMSLLGMGFANTTNGFLMIGENNLKRAKVAESILTDWKVAYPAVHVGMSLIPLAHNYVSDNEVANNPEGVTKLQAMQNNIWIPAAVLGGTTLGFLKGADLIKAGRVANMFTPVKHGAAMGVPYFMLDRWNTNLFKPSFTPNFAQPSFDFKPLGVPAYNLNNINTSSLNLEESEK